MHSPVPIHFDLPDVKEVKNKLHLVVELRVAVLCEHDGLVAGRANGEGSLKLEQPQIKLISLIKTVQITNGKTHA